ncbi:hypothetical protein NBRC110019_10320 [Neptunitalea chrysea]|uniref:DNA topoisomerase IV n=1 Tax=Neptunitalea chrysea TaxID=1647581 RepID=A0A9W6B3N9_9FLAO|nr:DNA topoisomerase IV [Neptunitalea chrysea]GLB51993.1 hypothetical protein NBRC110019_10320 [Neptunitalea chrysea]
MKYLALLTFIVVSIIGCGQPERNCKDFRTGEFKYEVELDGERLTGKFTRYQEIQVEIYSDHKVDSSTINWVNDCEFIAKNLHPKSMADKKPLLFKILTTDSDSYTFEFSYVGDVTNRHKGIATKID